MHLTNPKEGLMRIGIVGAGMIGSTSPEARNSNRARLLTTPAKAGAGAGAGSASATAGGGGGGGAVIQAVVERKPSNRIRRMNESPPKNM